MDGTREPAEQLDRRLERRGEEGVRLVDLALGNELDLDGGVRLDDLIR